jgi:hypothetical protein
MSRSGHVTDFWHLTASRPWWPGSPVGARYSATPAWGDRPPVRFGMIGVRDLAAGVPDLLSAQRLDCAPRAVGSVHDCGDLGAAPPGERVASAGRTPSADLGRSCPDQRAGPTPVQSPPPTTVRHPRHAPTLARRVGLGNSMQWADLRLSCGSRSWMIVGCYCCRSCTSSCAGCSA